MQIPDISILSLFLCALILIVPVVTSLLLKLNIVKYTLIAIIRMAVQLVLIGIFLKYLFQINHTLLNIAWILIMILVATFNVTRRTNLRTRKFLVPTFLAFIFSTLVVLFYVTAFVIKLDNIVDARYFIVIGGMLLGNSMRGNIIGIGDFYKMIRRDEQRYLYNLSLGATKMESLLPYFKGSLNAALQPTIAMMATMGIVFLPGMMTGQILGGVSPLLAIKYQIVIMISIYVSTVLAINSTILMTLKICFNSYGLLNKNIFVDSKS